MKILILYYIDKGSIKYTQWHDGFTRAIQILKDIYKFNINMINFNIDKNVELNNFDIVFIKWGFGSIMETYAKNYFQKKSKKCKMGIFISSINKPSNNQLSFYDILFYETYWYYKYAHLHLHPLAIHAFGIDNNIMKKTSNSIKLYDYIFVGSILSYKRPLNLLKKNGKKLAIGFLSDMNLVTILKKNGVSIKSFVTYDNLAKLYNASKICYVPCLINGGGERSVLEARACGLKVEIEKDNPKLKELLTSPIYDCYYYAKQINVGIQKLLNK